MMQDTSKDKLIEFIYELLKEKHQLKNDYSKVVHESTEHESKVYELQEENQRLKEMKYKTLIELQERIDNAVERLEALIAFWKKYNPIDNTMQIEQFKGVISILKGVKDE